MGCGTGLATTAGCVTGFAATGCVPGFAATGCVTGFAGIIWCAAGFDTGCAICEAAFLGAGCADDFLTEFDPDLLTDFAGTAFPTGFFDTGTFFLCVSFLTGFDGEVLLAETGFFAAGFTPFLGGVFFTDFVGFFLIAI